MERNNFDRRRSKMRRPGIEKRLTKAHFRKKPVVGEKISIPGKKHHVSYAIPVQLHDLVWEEADRNGVTLGTLISDIINSVVSITAEDLQAQKVLDKTADQNSLYCYLA